jgi:hypothetical protein
MQLNLFSRMIQISDKTNDNNFTQNRRLKQLFTFFKRNFAVSFDKNMNFLRNKIISSFKKDFIQTKLSTFCDGNFSISLNKNINYLRDSIISTFKNQNTHSKCSKCQSAHLMNRIRVLQDQLKLEENKSKRRTGIIFSEYSSLFLY